MLIFTRTFEALKKQSANYKLQNNQLSHYILRIKNRGKTKTCCSSREASQCPILERELEKRSFVENLCTILLEKQETKECISEKI